VERKVRIIEIEEGGRLVHYYLSPDAPDFDEIRTRDDLTKWALGRDDPNPHLPHRVIVTRQDLAQ